MMWQSVSLSIRLSMVTNVLTGHVASFLLFISKSLGFLNIVMDIIKRLHNVRTQAPSESNILTLARD